METCSIHVFEANCTFCRRCQLGCSNAYTREFNQNTANIRIEVSGLTCSITFSDDCRKCGICVDHCFYGALQKVAKEAA